MIMKPIRFPIIFAALLSLPFQNAFSFTIKISGDGGEIGTQASSSECRANGEEALTGNAGLTVYTDEYAYSGDRSLKLTIKEGSTGFGTFGGSINFEKCAHLGGRNLVKGDEIWIRTRLLFPSGFEFNNGSNKFLRLRSYNTVDGKTSSEGYNDLYIHGHPEKEDLKPFWYIFEGEQRWYTFGEPRHFFEDFTWKTVEWYLKFDNKKESEGGDARMRVWVDGELIGDTGERRTLKTDTSFIKYFNLFTWYGNEGSPKTQSLYVDDFFMTTDAPESFDADGNRFIGVGDPRTVAKPGSPVDFAVQ
ncbi:hypothetical protein C9993_07820 [Marinobacter sp. Z-F4-2]|nr:hypothetical protein C9993_07820 [Marinobacter sp. Z-F4-2]